MLRSSTRVLWLQGGRSRFSVSRLSVLWPPPHGKAGCRGDRHPSIPESVTPIVLYFGRSALLGILLCYFTC